MVLELPWWILPTAISAGIFIISYTLGRSSTSAKVDEIIEVTIMQLIERGYVRHRKVNGEIELLKIDDSAE